MSKLHIVFDNPVIPNNTGNAIRTSAVTGASLHLIEPLGFNFEDKNLKRAGLDYHDLADVHIHSNFDACMNALPHSRVFAFPPMQPLGTPISNIKMAMSFYSVPSRQGYQLNTLSILE